mgnify:FL=1
MTALPSVLRLRISVPATKERMTVLRARGFDVICTVDDQRIHASLFVPILFDVDSYLHGLLGPCNGLQIYHRQRIG